MIQAVIFDIDNTLYSYDRAHRAAYAALKRYCGEAVGLSPEDFEALHKAASRILEQRAGMGPVIHNRLIRYQLMLEEAGLPIAWAPTMAELYWRGLLGAMEPSPGARQAILALKAAGIRIGVGTNMTADWQFAKLEGLGLLPQVDFLVTSEELGAEKPDPRLFLLCAEKAGCPPEACAFVGDSLEKDALAAARVGMLGIWYHPEPASPPEGILPLGDFARLPELILSME